MPGRAHHVALLGDSIFDNGSYTSGEPDVCTHLRRMLPSAWTATLLARDGATTAGIEAQLRELPTSVSHLVLSVGGNDALANIDLLNLPVRSTREALELFHARQTRFEAAYQAVLRRIGALGLPTTVCTIYNGNFAEREEARAARIALMMFNDTILRGAFAAKLQVIDLRSVCAESADYANAIEPSGRGGAKIARAIMLALGLQEAHVARVLTG